MTNQKPVSKKRRAPTSIWEIAEDFDYYSKKVSAPIFMPLRELGLDGWAHWPHPMNFAAEVDTLACEDGWAAEIKLYAVGFAWFFWTQIIPSPLEITRKLLLGSYKCGFYLPIKIKSPLIYVIGQNRLRILAAIARPFTTALFWWWVVGSAFAALSTWHTIQEAKKACPDDKEYVLCTKAGGSFTGSGAFSGQNFDTVSDPHGHMIAGASAVSYSSGPVKISFGVKVTPRGMTGGQWWLEVTDGGSTVLASGPQVDKDNDLSQDMMTFEFDDGAPTVLLARMRFQNVTHSGLTPLYSFEIFTASGPA